jgi:hypothetical protein
MIGEANVRLCPQFMAAEDFGFYSQRIPAAFFSVGVHNAETGKIHHVHSPHFDIDGAALPIGAALHAAVAIEYLNKQASAPRPSCSQLFTATPRLYLFVCIYSADHSMHHNFTRACIAEKGVFFFPKIFFFVTSDV